MIEEPVDDVIKHGPKQVHQKRKQWRYRSRQNVNLIQSYNLVKRVKQEGQPGSKTITTPITVNPLTGEKVGEVNQQKITKQPVDKIVEFGGEKYRKVIKISSIQTYQQIKRKKYQVNQELRIQTQEK